MRVRILHLPAHRNARVIAALAAAATGVAVAAAMAALPLATGNVSKGEAAAWLLLAPLVQGGLAYVVTALACLFYNLLAPRLGGLEFALAADAVKADAGVVSRRMALGEASR